MYAHAREAETKTEKKSTFFNVSFFYNLPYLVSVTVVPVDPPR